MDKVDYKKVLKEYYSAKKDTPIVVDIPAMNFIMLDGKGDPNTSQDYIDAIQTLYPVAYAIKFICKRKYDHDFGVMPLEGLWWTENMADFNTDDKSNWLWRAMIMQPDIVTEEIFAEAVEQVRQKKSPDSLNKLRFASYNEGRAAQVLYLGPYSGEGSTIRRLHAFIAEKGGVLTETTKHHHEIYLGDPRRTEPAKLKTIIRQPF